MSSYQPPAGEHAIVLHEGFCMNKCGNKMISSVLADGFLVMDRAALAVSSCSFKFTKNTAVYILRNEDIHQS